MEVERSVGAGCSQLHWPDGRTDGRRGRSLSSSCAISSSQLVISKRFVCFPRRAEGRLFSRGFGSSTAVSMKESKKKEKLIAASCLRAAKWPALLFTAVR